MTKRSWSVTPQTVGGKLSVILIVAMPILFYMGTSFSDTLYASTPAGETIFMDIAARPALALTMLAGMAAGVSAFGIGLLAIFRQKEKGILVYIATVIGALHILFLASEIMFPH